MPRGRKRKVKTDKRRNLKLQKKNLQFPSISTGPSSCSEDENLNDLARIVESVQESSNSRQDINGDTIEAAIAAIHAESSGDDANLIVLAQSANRNNPQPGPSGIHPSYGRRFNASDLRLTDSGK